MSLAAIGIVAGVAAIGVGAAGAAGAFDPAKPDYRGLSKEVRDYLKQQQPILASHQTYDPQYAQLYNRLQREALFGGESAGGPGLLELYKSALPGMTDAANKTHESQYANEVGLYGKFSPRILEAYKSANPEQSALIDKIVSSASGELGHGTELSPVQQRDISQSIRAAQSNRGMGFGQADAAQEALGSVVGGENLYQTRLGNAQSAAQLYASLYPSMSVPNPGSAPPATGTLAQLLGFGGSPANYAAGQFGTPYNSYSSNLYDTNLGAQMNYNNTIANIRAASAKQIAGGVGNVAGGFGGGGGGGGMGGGGGGGFDASSNGYVNPNQLNYSNGRYGW